MEKALSHLYGIRLNGIVCAFNSAKLITYFLIEPASSLQYYHIAMTILCLAEPTSEPTNILQHIGRMKSLEHKLEYHAIQVSALAVSSNFAAVWVNAFGPISFCISTCGVMLSLY